MDSSHGKRSGLADLASVLCRLSALGYPVQLKKWENTRIVEKKRVMDIPLSGANINPPEILNTQEKPATPVTRQSDRSDTINQADAMNQKPEMQDNTAASPGKKPKTSLTPHLNNGNHSEMKNKPVSNHSNFVTDALNTVQEGLKSMQVLQQQTAETHQKFLETQQVAGRSLQTMMESTQRLAEATLGIPSGPAADPVSTPKNIRESNEIIENNHLDTVHSGSIEKRTSVEEERRTIPAEKPPANLNKQPEFADSGIKRKQSVPLFTDLDKILLETVSKLTGYPVEMLGLDMDIEADLGIDSIKRVEILSALEEKTPDLPTISPDIMGSLKTLGQIVDYLSDQHGTDNRSIETIQSNHTQPSQPEAAPMNTSSFDSKEIEIALLETVSQLTGYPVEMLGFEMDIEADLGIDSIKRVEILSALEEKIPDIPTISPDIMGGLKNMLVERTIELFTTGVSCAVKKIVSKRRNAKIVK